MTQSPEITWKSWLMVAALGLTWGGTFFLIELGLKEITPYWLAAARIGFAALIMLVIWVLMGARLFKERPSRLVLVNLVAVSILSAAAPFMFISWGQQHVTSGFAGVSMAAVALIVLPLAHFLIPGERMTWLRACGFVVGFIGVTILIGAQAFESSGSSLELAGRLSCFGGAACYAFSSVFMRKLPAIDPIGLATILVVIGTAIVVPVAFVMEGPLPAVSTKGLGILAILGILPTALAGFLRVMVIRTAGPVFMSLTNYQVPVWSVVLGGLILSEPLPPSLLYALVLILCGVAMSQYHALRRLFGGLRGR